MRAAAIALLLAAHVRWSADAFGLRALPAGRGLGVGRLAGDLRAHRACALGPGRGLRKPGSERTRRRGVRLCAENDGALPPPDEPVDDNGEGSLPLTGKGDMLEQSIEGRGAEGPGAEAGAEKGDASERPELTIPAGPTRSQIRSKKAFQVAWREKFKGKGVKFVRGSAAEATSKLGREIETDPLALQDLRARVTMLQSRLEAAVAEERYQEAAALRDELRAQRLRDPLQLREQLWSDMTQAGKAGNLSSAVNLRRSVASLEAFLPQYQLGGEWEGIYASHGKETVSIRYEGSTLVAVKMTGDNNVPKGEITFTADLSPAGLLGPVGRDSLTHPAEKIRLVLEDHLDNIVAVKGRGQVAKPGFKSPQFIDGQLLIFEEGVLGFIFLPLASMIVFERQAPLPQEPADPSPTAVAQDPQPELTEDKDSTDVSQRDRDVF